MSNSPCDLWFQVLLVSSSRHPDRWIVPGGGMEPEEEPSVAAVREVCEEVRAVDTAVSCLSPVSSVLVVTGSAAHGQHILIATVFVSPLCRRKAVTVTIPSDICQDFVTSLGCLPAPWHLS